MKKSTVLFSIIIICSVLLLRVNKTEAASLYLSPKSGIYSIGSSFSVKVMLDTEEALINAADATLSFNPSELEVVGISKTNSIFNFWTLEPGFNNSEGLIEFAGGKTSGFTGSDGNILSITFKALANITSKVNFTAGAVLAQDGKATNILNVVQGGTYDLEPEIIIPPSKRGEEPLIIPKGAPLVPVVFSSTHANEDAWYSNQSPEFWWEIPPDITSVRLSIDKDSVSLPDLEYPSSTKQKRFENMEDGIWYFHIRFKNEYGWGEITHRKVLIDTEPPDLFDIDINTGGDDTNPSPILSFGTDDSLSGIGYYEIKISDSESIRIEEDEYKIPPQKPGLHTVIIKAFDLAKNLITVTAEFKLEPIESPKITEYPATDEIGNALVVRGSSSYPESTLTLFIKKEEGGEEEREIKTDKKGNWTFVYDKILEQGIYQIFAVVTDDRGAVSNPSEKITIIVSLPLLIKIGQVAIDYLTVILSLVGLVIILTSIIIYTRNKILQWRKRLKKETKDVVQSVVKAFILLEEKIQQQVENLDKKPGLSDSEKEIYNELKGALNSSKEIIGKEIKDVEDELK
jgi:hypothetical protein